MQIVINIPKQTYNFIMNRLYMPVDEDLIVEAVRNGTPLPKGHGRLIDADEIIECEEIMNTISGESRFAVRMDDIRNMPTIIEADEVESEDKE